MTGVYLTWLADAARAAGVRVIEQAGWQTRARSSGGFADGRPVCVMFHHTASPPGTSAAADADYCSHGSDNRPVCNLMIARDAAVWTLAAGATNTNGTGGPVTIPPGVTVPADSMNTWAVGLEICNDGLGEPYPAAQVDAAFAVSLAVTARLGLPPDAVCLHALGAGDGWTSRKIDPARADAVQGPWRPSSTTSSGTWSLDDLRAQLRARAAGTTPPAPASEGDDVPRQLVRNGADDDYHVWVVFDGGKFYLPTNEAIAIQADAFGYDPLPVSDEWMAATGPVIGPNPTTDPRGVWSG